MMDNDFLGYIKFLTILLGATIGSFLGEVDGLLYALIILIIADYLTGVICAIANKCINSEVGFKGIAKKVLIFALVGIANIVDVHVLGSGSAIRTAVIFFYLANEAISIIENAAKLGLPIPKKLKNILEQLKDENDKEDNNES